MAQSHNSLELERGCSNRLVITRIVYRAHIRREEPFNAVSCFLALQFGGSRCSFDLLFAVLLCVSIRRNTQTINPVWAKRARDTLFASRDRTPSLVLVQSAYSHSCLCEDTDTPDHFSWSGTWVQTDNNQSEWKPKVSRLYIMCLFRRWQPFTAS